MEREERRILERLNIAAYYMSDIDHLGIERVVEEGLQRVDTTNTARIHLSFDIDALDPRGEYNVYQGYIRSCTVLYCTALHCTVLSAPR